MLHDRIDPGLRPGRIHPEAGEQLSEGRVPARLAGFDRLAVEHGGHGLGVGPQVPDVPGLDRIGASGPTHPGDLQVDHALPPDHHAAQGRDAVVLGQPEKGALRRGRFGPAGSAGGKQPGEGQGK